MDTSDDVCATDEGQSANRASATASKARRTRRLWKFRTLACLLAFTPVLGAELAIRLGGWADKPVAADPFVDLSELKPLFDLSQDGQRYEIGPQRMHLFKPASFPARKASGTFRVFALGGSTTQGEPYSTESAFPKWLQLNLTAMMPDRTVEVINCGGLSYASYRVKCIADEVLGYEPDLIVIYTGHNEYLEKRSYEDWQRRGLFRRGVDWIVSCSRLCQVIKDNLQGPATRESDRGSKDASSKTRLAAEVDALLDYKNGLDDYHRGDAWQSAVPEHLGWNVQATLRNCKIHSVPAFAILPVSNLADCPPMKFETAPTLGEQQRVQFKSLWDEAIAVRVDQPATAIDKLRSALEIDPGHAGALFLLGTLLMEAGDVSEAEDMFVRARDHDVCKLRATTELRSQLQRAYEAYAIPTFDAQQFFEDISSEPVLGSQWLVDHIHPSVAGHRRMGRALAEQLTQVGIVTTQSGWEDRAEELCDQHQSTLGEAYFQRGKQRLEGLMLWTQGRAKKLRPEKD